MTQDPTGGHGEQPPAGPPAYGQPPQAPGYGTPPGPPQYGQPPQQPQQPSYGAPPSYGQQQYTGQQPPPYGQPPQQQYGGPPAAQQPLRPEEEKQYAMFAHLGGVVGILPSLIIFLVFKDRGPFVREQSKEALNFQITMLIAYVASLFVTAILSFIFWTPFGLNWLVWVISVVFSVMGGMAANRGENYRYPFAIRVVS